MLNVMKKKLTDKSVDEVIEYFKFENMKNEPDFVHFIKTIKMPWYGRFKLLFVCLSKF